MDAVLAPRARRVCLDDEAIEERMQVEIRADDPADPEPVAKMLAVLAVGDLILHHHCTYGGEERGKGKGKVKV